LAPDELNEISFGRVISSNPSEQITVALTPAGDFAALLENKVIGIQLCATPSLVAVKG